MGGAKREEAGRRRGFWISLVRKMIVLPCNNSESHHTLKPDAQAPPSFIGKGADWLDRKWVELSGRGRGEGGASGLVQCVRCFFFYTYFIHRDMVE